MKMVFCCHFETVEKKNHFFLHLRLSEVYKWYSVWANIRTNFFLEGVK